jgi:hypothetical protein
VKKNMHSINFTVEVSAMPPVGKLIAMRIQNVTKNKWYNWDNGNWDSNGTPKGDPTDQWYFNFYAQNTGGAGTIGILLISNGQALNSASLNVPANGTMELQHNAGVISASKTFTVQVTP